MRDEYVDLSPSYCGVPDGLEVEVVGGGHQEIYMSSAMFVNPRLRRTAYLSTRLIAGVQLVSNCWGDG